MVAATLYMYQYLVESISEVLVKKLNRIHWTGLDRNVLVPKSLYRFFPKSYHCYIHNMENWNKVTYLICYMYSTPLCSICSFWEFIFWRLNSIKRSFRITHIVIFPIKKKIPLSTNMIFTNRRNFQNDALFKRLTFAIQFLNSLNIKSLLEIIIIYIYVL